MKITDFKNLGLKEREAKIYLAALEMGYASVQGIARKAGTNRVAVYQVLDVLKSKNLIHTTYKGKRKVYVAAKPESLLGILKDKKESVEQDIKDYQAKLLPELLGMYDKAEGKPKVSYYEIEEGLEKLVSACLSPEDNNIFGVSSYGIVPDKYRVSVSKLEEMIKKGKIFQMLLIYRKKAEEDIKRLKLFPGATLVPLEETKASPSCAMYACNKDKVFILYYLKNPFVLMIENKAIYDTFKFVIESTKKLHDPKYGCESF